MKTEIMQVTPSMAKLWLSSNTSNRPLRQNGVERLRAIWERGEWKLTHQGIAFGSDGVLKDGQHRLTFISTLPDGAMVPLMVTFDLDNDVFGVLDTGIRRTLSDECGISQGHSALAAFVTKVHEQNILRGQQTSRSMLKYVDFTRPYHEELAAFCNTATQIWSSAPVRAAAVIQMARGHNADFVKSAYRSLVLRDIPVMTPAAQSLFKQVIDGKAGSARSLDLFARALRVFDSSAPSTKRIQVSNVSEVTADVRAFLDVAIGKSTAQKKAPPKRGNGNQATPL